ncbi:MAG: bifunctional oligoribonuclease/PAP phosphatase NrnA [Lachnospiraceae bacterium]|nr:bifunctional oligoribonuclease/PAP phosphatase NrnA [Lachnospiraceae bacterium]
MNILEEIKGASTIGIGGHVRPDGDCIGASMGLYLYLTKACPEAKVEVFLEKPADVFSCIGKIDQIHTDFTTEVEQFDVFIALDTSKDRLGEAQGYFDHAKKRINVDHHVSNSGCGDVDHIRPEASSTSELVYEMIQDKSLIDEEIAKALYIGIIHDTGVFQYSNTSPATLKTAAELVSYGFDFPKLIEETFYEKSYVQTQILGRALLESILFMDGKCVVSMVDKKTMKFYQAQPYDLEGIVSQLRNIKEVECAIFMYQLDTLEYKVSLRSGGKVDVAKIASFFGGGGHKRAAGVTMQGTFHDIVNNLSAHIDAQLKEIDKQAED